MDPRSHDGALTARTSGPGRAAAMAGVGAGDGLEAWADGCDDPDGRRATMARAIAQLRRVAPLEVA